MNKKIQYYFLTVLAVFVLKHNVFSQTQNNPIPVRNYLVQVYQKGKWATICKGLSIGHKRIQQFEPVLTRKIRLIIPKAAATPQIKKFSVFFVED